MKYEYELDYSSIYFFVISCIVTSFAMFAFVIQMVNGHLVYLAPIYLIPAAINIVFAILTAQDLGVEPALVTENGIAFRRHTIRKMHIELRVMAEFQWSDIQEVILHYRRRSGIEHVKEINIGGVYTPDKPGAAERNVLVTVPSSAKGFNELLQTLQTHLPDKIREAGT